MKLQNKKILVTGASGFIGSHLVEALMTQSAAVRCLVHYNGRNDWGHLEELDPAIKKNLDVVLGDIQDPFLMRKAVQGCDVVFHLASLIAIPYSYIAPLSFVTTNTVGTLNVMQACLDEGVSKVVHTSTSETYGTAVYAPIDEKHPLQGQSPYSASKIGADKIVESFFCSFRLPVSTLRPFNAYGPRQSARAVIPTIITQALTQPVIRLGLLTPIRDLTFVKDTVRGFVAMAECDDAIGEVINLGSGRGIRIGELASKILELLNIQKEIISEPARVRPESSEVMQLICDSNKAKNLLQWAPAVDLASGLEQTIRFVKSHLSNYHVNREHLQL